VATYENEIYVIGGETTQGVTATVEQYNPASDTWATLAPKPMPVADVSAAVIGGWIYVPGGLTAAGAVTDVLEAYDPRGNRWEQRASLPVALSAYALVAFEGRLYLFGGWDGHGYVASVYAYDPSRDQWTKQTPMPTARGYPGAAVTGDKIYVMGGTDGTQTLAVNEAYVPESEARGENPWQKRAPLPAGRFRWVVSVAGIVHRDGGEGSPNIPVDL
jgi:N-acetylneuraminic acid mutarotase